jgi:hypothetical protein
MDHITFTLHQTCPTICQIILSHLLSFSEVFICFGLVSLHVFALSYCHFYLFIHAADFVEALLYTLITGFKIILESLFVISS